LMVNAAAPNSTSLITIVPKYQKSSRLHQHDKYIDVI